MGDIQEPTNPARGDIQPISQILGEADDTLRGPQQAPPTEEIFIDGKSYFSERIRNPWDCESILSTYSNLDNNPTTIDNESQRRRRRPKKSRSSNKNNLMTTPDENQTITLSEKTGMPLGVFPNSKPTDGSHYQTHNDTETYMSVNKGEKRSKKETSEQKKLRKMAVKKERQLA